MSHLRNLSGLLSVQVLQSGNPLSSILPDVDRDQYGKDLQHVSVGQTVSRASVLLRQHGENVATFLIGEVVEV